MGLGRPASAEARGRAKLERPRETTAAGPLQKRGERERANWPTRVKQGQAGGPNGERG